MTHILQPPWARGSTRVAQLSDKLGLGLLGFYSLFIEKIKDLWGAGAKLPSA